MTHSMVAFFALLSFALHANSMSAASFPCLTDAHAHEIIADQIISVSQALGYVEAIKRLHTKDAIGISDSINFVMGLPLNTTITRSRKELLQQSKGLPPIGNIKTLFLSHTRDTITLYFEFGTMPLPTWGITIFFVNAEHKVYKSYREVNSGALLYNLGQPECDPDFTVSVGDEGLEPTEAACVKPCTVY